MWKRFSGAFQALCKDLLWFVASARPGNGMSPTDTCPAICISPAGGKVSTNSDSASGTTKESYEKWRVLPSWPSNNQAQIRKDETTNGKEQKKEAETRQRASASFAFM